MNSIYHKGLKGKHKGTQRITIFRFLAFVSLVKTFVFFVVKNQAISENLNLSLALNPFSVIPTVQHSTDSSCWNTRM